MGDWIKSTKKAKNKDGKWEVKVRVCNPTDRDINNVLITEHPYSKDGPKIGDQPDSQFRSLKKKGSKDSKGNPTDCVEVTFGPYDKEPGADYTDVYEKLGVAQDLKYRDGTWHHPLASLPIPPAQGGRTVVGYTTHLPYPWRAAMAIGTPLSFFPKSITGLPDAWSVSFMRPQIGEAVLLSPDVKHYPVFVELETRNPVEEGFHFTLEINFGIMGCPDDLFHSGTLGAHLARDTQGPTITVQTVSQLPEEGTQLRVTANDDVTGIELPTIRYSHDGGTRWVTEYLDPIEEDFRDAFQVSGSYRATVPTMPGKVTSYVIRVADGLGNVSESPVALVSSISGDCVEDPDIPIEAAERAFGIEFPQEQVEDENQ